MIKAMVSTFNKIHLRILGIIVDNNKLPGNSWIFHNSYIEIKINIHIFVKC